MKFIQIELPNHATDDDVSSVFEAAHKAVAALDIEPESSSVRVGKIYTSL